MATTKIWPVKDSLARVVDYAQNPERGGTPLGAERRPLLGCPRQHKSYARYPTRQGCGRTPARGKLPLGLVRLCTGFFFAPDN